MAAQPTLSEHLVPCAQPLCPARDPHEATLHGPASLCLAHSPPRPRPQNLGGQPPPRQHFGER